MPVQTLSTGYIEEREQVWGFGGTREEARVTGVDAPIFYVNWSHANANDDNDGTDPNWPMKTLQALVDRSVAGTPQPILKQYSTVYCGALMREDVYVPATAPQNVTICGGGSHRW